MQTFPKSIYISHGGGPLPLLGDPQHAEMVDALKKIASEIPQPKAIVVVSAHWEAPIPTITAAAQPELIYDYYGFPPESYAIQYPCAGEPALANNVHDRLTGQNIPAKLDTERGLDHGAFVPLKIMYPEADIPCIQVSLLDSLDPAAHIALGRALCELHQDNVLVLGSGFSFHNLKAFFAPNTPESIQQNEAFENWLHQTCSNQNYSEDERREALIRWADAPGARFCHPREEHLLPLHVCYGAGQSHCRERMELTIMNKRSSIYLW